MILLTGRIYQSRGNGHEISFSNPGNVAKNHCEVKAGKSCALQASDSGHCHEAGVRGRNAQAFQARLS
jgi:hypothetical protein